MKHNTKFVDLASQNSANHAYPTRFNRSHNINIPRIHTSRVFCSIFYNAIIFWNKLPMSTRSLTNVLLFKKEIRSKLGNIHGILYPGIVNLSDWGPITKILYITIFLEF